MAIAVPRTHRFVRGETDEKLVTRVRGGDEQAFACVYDRYAKPLLSFCRHMLGDLHEAEDAVQHTFVAAHRALLADARDIYLKAWLFAIARNRCLSILRGRREHVGLEDGPAAPSTAGLAAEVEQREELREMLGDLGRLPEDQREALLLAELGAHSHDDIADVLGVKREKVKALVFQAREGLGAFREARMTPCAEIREQLATAKGGALRRGPLRRHLQVCDGCREFAGEVKRQRAALGIILPVVPSIALKQAVLGGTIGGGGAAAGAGLVSGSGAVAGAGAVGAAGVGAAGSLKAILGKVLVTSAVAAGAGGTAVGVHEMRAADSSPPPPASRADRPASPRLTATAESTPLPAVRKRAAHTADAPKRRAAAPKRHRRDGTAAPTVENASDTTVLPAQGAPANQVAQVPSKHEAPAAPAKPKRTPAAQTKQAAPAATVAAPAATPAPVPAPAPPAPTPPAPAPTTPVAATPVQTKAAKGKGLPCPPHAEHPLHPEHPLQPAQAPRPIVPTAIPKRGVYDAGDGGWRPGRGDGRRGR